MDITPYVTTDQIRAALGVSYDELTDEAISNQLLEEAIWTELDSIYPEHEAVSRRYFSTSESDQDLKVFRLLRLFSLSYCVAEISGHWLTFMKSIDDGKAAVTRNLNYETVSGYHTNANAKLKTWRSRLIAAREGREVNAENFAPTLLSISSPASNPVTNS